VARLEEELGAARALLSRFPEAGRAGTDDEDPSRRLLVRTLPLVLWYRVEGSRVIWLRLFHVRRAR
jgi:plasmid stabilization system protein ParE